MKPRSHDRKIPRKKRPPAGRRLREKAIEEYHGLLAGDPGLSQAALEKFHHGMRQNRLVYAERPIGVSLRPHLLEQKQFATLTRSAETVARALEKVAAAALRSPALMRELGLTELETKLALVDPGFSMAAMTTRLDAFIHKDEIKFVEYNAENPSSLSDQEGLNRLLFDFPAMMTFSKRYALRQFSPVERLLETLLATFREWSRSNRVPNIAIVDWRNLPTANEFVLIQEAFAAHDVRAIICSPDDLEYHNGRLRGGDFEIDLVYKRVLIHELLDKFDERHPLVRAYINRDVCMVNPFRCKILHKKASFAILTDPEHAHRFTPAEKEVIRRCVPWTRRVREGRTTCRGRSIDLLDFILKNRRSLVLKPNDDYGGHGVYLGSHTDDQTWTDAATKAVSGDYVVQEAVDLQPETFPIFGPTGWSLQPMFVDTNPFLFKGVVHGAMVRLSTSPVVNVTSGGGETGFFVIDREKSSA